MSSWQEEFPEDMYLVFPIPAWAEDARKWKPSYRIITRDEPRVMIHKHTPTEEGHNSVIETYWADTLAGYLYRRTRTLSVDCDGQTASLEVSRVGLEVYSSRERIEGVPISHYAIAKEFLQEPGNPFLKWETVAQERRDYQAEAANY